MNVWLKNIAFQRHLTGIAERKARAETTQQPSQRAAATKDIASTTPTAAKIANGEIVKTVCAVPRVCRTAEGTMPRSAP